MAMCRPVLRVTNTGVTAMVSADGRVIKRIAPVTPGVLVADVVRRTGQTPYVRWRDTWALWLLIAVAGLAAVVGFRAILASE